MGDYNAFLAAKSRRAEAVGFEIDDRSLPGALKPFQRAVVAWALRQGRAAMFEGTRSWKDDPGTRLGARRSPTHGQASPAFHAARRRRTDSRGSGEVRPLGCSLCGRWREHQKPDHGHELRPSSPIRLQPVRRRRAGRIQHPEGRRRQDAQSTHRCVRANPLGPC